MTKTELALRMGISRQMLYKLIDMGMPTDLQAATEWRNQNLDFFKTKAGRIDGNRGGKSREKIALSLDDLAVINDNFTDLLKSVKPKTESNTFRRGGIYRELFYFESKLLALNVTDDVRSQIKKLVTDFWNNLKVKN
jgi:hypothetical protein